MGIRLFRAFTSTEALVRVDRVGVGGSSSSSSSFSFCSGWTGVAESVESEAGVIMLIAILANEADKGFPSILILILPFEE
jgi:hypothetical protein